MEEKDIAAVGETILVKALEDGVVVVGMTRGRDTKLHHTERLNAGEVMAMQFTQTTSAIKIRGRAQVHSRYGMITSGE